jgi:hypothetical protein
MAECYNVSFICRQKDRIFGMNGVLYYSHDEITVDEMGRSCATYGENA